LSISLQLLIYGSKLKQVDYEGWGGTPELEAAVEQCMHDRLQLAQGFLAAAQRSLTTASDDVDYRNIVSRAYYVCHHAIRACILHRNNGDVEGHTEAIAAFGKMLSAEPVLQRRLDNRNLMALMHQRHLADYYPYGASYPREAPLEFATQAHLAVREAEQHLTAICDFIKGRGGKTP
jgi:uncharacterized protein (UPF0332 family)